MVSFPNCKWFRNEATQQSVSSSGCSLFYLGSRSALINMEARGSAANILNRKCVVLKWAELSSDSFLDLIQRGAGSLLILLPRDWSMEDNSTLKACIVCIITSLLNQ